jgi:hypothetical protein
MTIEELIIELQKVANQNQDAYVYADGANYKIVSVDDEGDMIGKKYYPPRKLVETER